MNSKHESINKILKKLSADDAQVILDALAEQELTEKRLRESEDKTRLWLEYSPACTKILDLDFNLQYMSNAGIAGLCIDDVTEFYGKPYPFYFFPEDAKAKMISNLQKVKETKQIISKEGPVYDLNRKELWFQATIIPICDEQGELEYLMVVSVATTERKRAQQQLAEEKERLDVTLKSIGDGVITTDIDGNVVLMNPIAETLTEWPLPEAKGNPLKDIFNIVNAETSTPVENPVAKVLESGQIIDLADHTVLISRNGTRYRIADSGAPIRDRSNEIIGVVLVFRDITEEYKIKEQLHQSQKMEAIGQLAGGIAHDFNNMLGGIIGATELLEDLIPHTPEIDGLYDIILKSSNKASDLTSKLLAFARKQPPASTVIDFHQTVEESVALLRNSIDRKINFVLALDAEQFNLVGDPSQLQSAVMNLAINSSHAMPRGGTITITSRTADLDAFYCDSSLFNIKAGLFIDLEVRDTGEGIPPEDLPRIFEPFFSSKGPNKGTGLGLAAVYGTIQQHGGSITAYSEVGKGTSIHIYLPLTTQRVEPQAPKPMTVQGSGIILLVDDEPLMLATAKANLERLGYSIETAVNGALALERFEENPEKYDLVLLDMIMPVMSGKECFLKMIEIRPDVCVVLSSGFTQEEDLGEMKRLGLRGFIGKPYRKDELSQTIHHALHSK